MFEWEYCHGCNDMETNQCLYNGRYWECPYANVIQEDMLFQEDDNL